MSEQVPGNLPCTKCGECCRHGGECVFRTWSKPKATPIAFEGVCEFLCEDSTCEMLTQACEQNYTGMKRFLPGVCDWPAQFLRHYHPITYRRFVVDEEHKDIEKGPFTEEDWQYKFCVSHCCQEHGCKYNHVRCPVVAGTSRGVTCEQCGLEEEEKSDETG